MFYRAFWFYRGQESSGRAIVSDRDIWRTAHAMIEQYCEDAPVRAAMRSDELLAQGDIEGRDVWLRVLSAITEIRRMSPLDDERLN